MTYLERLMTLSEFAMRLSVAKKFVKEVKSDPMVQPYLVNGKIRRSPYNNVHKSSNFTLPVGNAEGKVRGIVITKGKLISNKFPLEELAHEYGHAQHSAESLRTNNRLVRTIDEVNSGKRQIHNWKKYSATGNPMDTGATIQVKRIQESRRLTRERVATIGGANSGPLIPPLSYSSRITSCFALGVRTRPFRSCFRISSVVSVVDVIAQGYDIYETRGRRSAT